MGTHNDTYQLRRHAYIEAIVEIVMSALPIIIVFFVMSYLGKPMKLFAKPEWAFGAAILFGQCLMRLLFAMANPHRAVQGPKVVLFAACILVFGLAPSLMILVFIILGSENPEGVSVMAQFLQVILFGFSAVVYISVGVAAHELGKPRTV